MLRASLKTCSFILFLMTSGFVGLTHAAKTIESTYDYVPQEVKTMTGYQNSKEKKRLEGGLTTQQQQGMHEGKLFAKKYSSQIKSIKPNEDEVKTINEMKDKMNQVYQTTAHSMAAKQTTALYYFISFSMPDALIKAYLLDATWNGGILVVRGIPKGMTLPQFLQKKMLPLVQYKGSHARIEINPNLFEMYDVTMVPTLLIGKIEPSIKGCQSSFKKIPASTLSFQECHKMDSNRYWKIEGSLTTLWALNKLKESGAPTTPYIERVHGLRLSPVKDEKGFNGNWQKALMPYADGAIQSLLQTNDLMQPPTGAITPKK